MVIKGAQAHGAGDTSPCRLSALCGQRMSSQRRKPKCFGPAVADQTVRLLFSNGILGADGAKLAG